ncbi:MAG: flagellar motor protein [bacterium]|nr:flagellar motor protein [bacterium]
MDLASIIGLVLSFGLILWGNTLEGGGAPASESLSKLLQETAAMIVLGGTAGACVLQFPLATSIASLKSIVSVFKRKSLNPELTIAQIVEFAKRARREGILALEKEISNLDDPFFSKALRMAVDGLEPKQLIETMETELATFEEEQEGAVKFWEAAGGYAPTVGILGAVLGLIHVMSNLSDPAKLGGGIAVAFVATVYGVGSANLIFLPFSNKLRYSTKEKLRLREIMLKGVLLIQEGINHSIIEEQLKSYLSLKQKARYETKGAA